ncbi:MAG: ATP-dependent DNA helicase [Planctomycetota bacterium]
MSADGLNTAQRAAVEHRGSPLIVLAGPGTGKTRVITHRIARLLDEDGVAPLSVAAMTFTVKAAEEMRERLGRLVGIDRSEAITAGTFHAFGRGVIARFGDTIGLPSRPRLIDSAQRRSLLELSLAEAAAAGEIEQGRMTVAGPDSVLAQAWAWIESMRSRGVFPEEAGGIVERWSALVESPPDHWDGARIEAMRVQRDRFAEAAVLARRFEAACRAQGLATFDDFILLPIRILRESREAAVILRDEVRHVVVDEFQDVNGAQLSLVRELCPPGLGRDLCVVGDDDQSIYGFRGSDPRAFQRFAETWPDTTTLALEINYRSTRTLVGVSQRVIAAAGERFDSDKALRVPDEQEDGPAVEAIELPDHSANGQVIAAMILEDRAEHPERTLASYAVIGSTHSTLEAIGDALELAGLTVTRSRSVGVLDDEAVQDVLSWVRLLLEGEAMDGVRLLTRPPLRLEGASARELYASYRRSTARARVADEDVPGFPSWLRGKTDLTEPAAEAVTALLRQYDTLAERTERGSATEAVSAIVELADLAHSELLPGRERARRIAALVSVLRFVREAQGRIGPPGDLSAFWSHYQRLDEKEQSFRFEGENGIDGDDEGAVGGGVQLITAHHAKGLEFDTVFVPRIGAVKGDFGEIRKRDEPVLPAELWEEPEPSGRDEVRRLFYVAMTRAERRLVLLTKKAKTRSKSQHFVHELAWRGKQPLAPGEVQEGVAVLSDTDVYARAASAGVAAAGDPVGGEAADSRGATALERRAMALSGIRRRARAGAAEALDAAGRSDLQAEQLDTVANALRGHAVNLALAARAEAAMAGEPELPAWLAGASEAALLKRLVEQDAAEIESAPGGSPAWPGLKPPLELSFSAIDRYLRCPACFYLEHVLGLGDRASEAQAAGQATHTALETFYRAWSHADNEGLPKPGRDRLLALGREACLAALGDSGDAPLRVHLAQVEAQLGGGYDAFHDDQAEIVMLEERVRFGYARAGADEPPHRVTAKIDRVDRVTLPDGGSGFRIVDYKTGRAWDRLVEPEADDLQLGLYATALASRLEIPVEELRGTVEYWLFGTRQIGRLAIEAIDFAGVRGKADEAIEGMLEGRFEPRRGCRGACGSLLGRSPLVETCSDSSGCNSPSGRG